MKKRIAELKRDGLTIEQAVIVLNKEGVTTPRGLKFTHANLNNHWRKAGKRRARSDKGVKRVVKTVNNPKLLMIGMILQSTLADNDKLRVIKEVVS